MRYIGLIVLLAASSLNADTYFYRLDINKNSIQTVKGFISSVGMKSDQPYLNTNIMTQPDTNYFIISLTPKDGQDFKLDEKVAGVELFKIIELGDDYFFHDIIDNSWIFPVGIDWKVYKSSH